ncbi:hypothetical protein L5F43_09955 [Aliarcobacter butzleri]|uniref:Uncharacterized protein n=2 Tax=Aliarcobacter butzleri TaxID=28197 RepID=A0AAW7Q0R6_9BACT|nr:hypothetical protein [Aliarcobacter butzleri]KLE02210.1 hypothetical protein AA20_01170 [Aliarcobacter butzleri L348]MCG3655454.1 hypothetical protein [Aliarcobacter butzleri]MCG3684329.1 hypothetical protein [Aliarcobacter butzleri]MCG3686465.1 hypothetical protein [Aliarcobacter butzleri]MCG3688461.1 hypothetical protein [Aliarcobacter butzleri]
MKDKLINFLKSKEASIIIKTVLVMFFIMAIIGIVFTENLKGDPFIALFILFTMILSIFIFKPKKGKE